MGLFIRQDESRTELQKRLAAELQSRANKNSKQIADRPDGVDDSEYIKGTKATTSLAWAWVLILVAVAGIIIWLTVISATR